MSASCPCQSRYRCSQLHSRSRRRQRLVGPHRAAAHSRPEVQLYDYHDQLIPYEQAWSWQKQQVDALAAAASQPVVPPGRLLLLQHPPVYTLGAGATPDHLRFDAAAPPHPLHRVERGGEVTYHGPGQLVMYPLLDLTRHTRDLHWYLRALEQVVVEALAAASGLAGERLTGLTGVWVGGAKVAAIGVRAKKWVTYHGLALNVVTDLTPFSHIVPCGIQDRPVTSVHQLLAAAGQPAPRAVPLAQSATPGQQPHTQLSSSPLSPEQQQQQQEAAMLLLEYRYALLEAFEEVFQVQLVPPPPQEAAATAAALLGPSPGPGATPQQQQPAADTAVALAASQHGQ